jgi:putative endonuclease
MRNAMAKQPAVYILANHKNGTLYIGVTSDILKRIWLHKSGVIGGFTKSYKVHMLVYFEIHPTMQSAILREKQLKKWNRRWKMRLIEGENPTWRDLYEEICCLLLKIITGFPPRTPPLRFHPGS